MGVKHTPRDTDAESVCGAIFVKEATRLWAIKNA